MLEQGMLVKINGLVEGSNWVVDAMLVFEGSLATVREVSGEMIYLEAVEGYDYGEIYTTVNAWQWHTNNLELYVEPTVEPTVEIKEVIVEKIVEVPTPLPTIEEMRELVLLQDFKNLAIELGLDEFEDYEYVDMVQRYYDEFERCEEVAFMEGVLEERAEQNNYWYFDSAYEAFEFIEDTLDNWDLLNYIKSEMGIDEIIEELDFQYNHDRCQYYRSKDY